MLLSSWIVSSITLQLLLKHSFNTISDGLFIMFGIYGPMCSYYSTVRFYISVSLFKDRPISFRVQKARRSECWLVAFCVYACLESPWLSSSSIVSTRTTQTFIRFPERDYEYLAMQYTYWRPNDRADIICHLIYDKYFSQDSYEIQ